MKKVELVGVFARLPKKLNKKLDKVRTTERRPKGRLIEDAITFYLALSPGARDDLRQGISTR